MIFRRRYASLLLATGFLCCQGVVGQQIADQAAADRAERHAGAEWAMMAPHLPDMDTSPVDALVMAADVLRARRLPEDALEFYEAALRRGGDGATLMNRIGVTELELHRMEQARAAFKRSVDLRKKAPEGWNNLGATEYMAGNYRAAISDYQHAVKLNKKDAVFHSNLGTAYFEVRDYESARRQFDLAVTLDANVFVRGGLSGVQARVLSPQDRGRFCFEMAKLAARHHDDEGVMHWLAKASETAFSLEYEMRVDKDFAAYSKDERVALLLRNAKALHAKQMAAAGPAPALAAEAPR